MRSLSLVIVSLFFLNSCTTQKAAQIEDSKISMVSTSGTPKNIILLIGDGMGLTQLSAGIYSNNNKSYFEKMKTIGLHKSYAYDNLITDSAAGATAFASGIKTYNNAIGVDKDTNSVITILEEAEERGMATGLIATSSITHATPASFIAHNKFRKNAEEIAEDFLKTEIDFFVGGGKSFFSNRKNDDRNLMKELEGKGYVVEDFFDKELSKVKVDPTKNFAYFTANEEPLPASQGRDYLKKAVSLGLTHLDQHTPDKGFFLMIEGSQIDWGGHANDTEYIISEWKEFNEVLGYVLNWAEIKGETLVIVTADHETGGFAIQEGSELNKIIGAFTSPYHTGTLIPVFAKGPGEELFRGIYENTEIYHKMKAAFGWTQ